MSGEMGWATPVSAPGKGAPRRTMDLNRFFPCRGAKNRKPVFGGLEILQYIGPGLLVTVGFIDPGNWAANLAAGADYGYTLLWMVTLSTVMLIVLQHNAAHLGIISGLCLSEAATRHMPRALSLPLLLTACGASVATSFAELLGAALALRMLFGVPLWLGATLSTLVVGHLLLANSYRKVEKWIIGFVSLIGISFLYEMWVVGPDWKAAAIGWIKPDIPPGAMLVVMSVLGAVVMPHNLFLHSEIIQSRQWNLADEKVIERQLKYEYVDTIVSMLIGWAINSAMIILAAAEFFAAGHKVNELEQAQDLLTPLLGGAAAVVFALALLLAGIASSVTSGMAGASIVAGMFSEPYDVRDNHSRLGIVGGLGLALGCILLTNDPFWGLIISQMLLSVQLPLTVAAQIYLTSSRKVMGKYANPLFSKIVLCLLAAIVVTLNVMLLLSAL